MAAAVKLPFLILACGAAVLALNMGVRQTFGLFLEPMTLDLGISRGNFSLAIAVQIMSFCAYHLSIHFSKGPF